MLTLESGPARLDVAPETGGRIVSLRVDDLDLLVTRDVDGDNSGDRPAVLRWPGALTVTLETACRCVVVFDEPENAICVESQIDPPNAFNLGPTIVRPGEPLVATATWSWRTGTG